MADDFGKFGFRKVAFTLAEVLITLGIIGVVAALTIPTLVSNYQKNQVIEQLKKTFSVLTQSVNQAIAENGEISSWDWGTSTSTSNNQNFVNKYFKPYMSIAKDCGSSTTGSCVRAARYTLNNKPLYLTGHYYIVLQDGVAVFISITIDNNAYDGVYAKVDLNGNKPPNILGKDIFSFVLYKSNAANKRQVLDLYGTGYNLTREQLISSSTWGCNKENADASSLGDFCGALIQMDGWQMKNDYPW